MKTISAVTINGLHGINKIVKINNRLTIVTGKNGAGKTTLSKAIWFGFKGIIPGLSEKDKDMFTEISAGKESCGSIISGDGLLIERALTRTGKITKHSGSVNGGSTLNSKSALNGAMSAVGADKIRLLSMTDFFNSSDAKMVAFLSGFYRGEDYTFPGILAKFNEKYHRSQTEISKISTHMELLDLILGKIKKLKTSYNADKKSAGATIASLSREQESIARPAGQLHEIEKEIDDLSQTASQIRADLSKVGADSANLKAWQDETKANKDAIESLEQSLHEVLKVGGPGLKEPRDYQWQMDRCRNEKAKAAIKPDAQIIKFANEMIDGMKASGCDACSAVMIAKKKILSCRPKTINIAELEKEFRGWEDLRNKAIDLRKLKEVRARLAKDQRSKLLTSSEDEAQQNAEGIAKRLKELQDQKTAFEKVANLDSTIERTRLAKTTAETELSDIKKAEAEDKKLRSDIASAIFTPAKEAVDKFLPNGESVFGFNANGKLLIAWHIEGREKCTPRLGLSDSERAQFDAVLSVGLLSLMDESNPAILTVKAGEVSRQNLIPFCKTLEKAPENVQIFVETWLDDDIPAPEVEGWETINMEY